MDGLFPKPRRQIGRIERAAERIITEWRKTGHTVDPATSAAIRAAGEACDLAQRDATEGDSTGFSYGRTVAIWIQIVRESSPNISATDAVDDALVQLLADADAAAS